MLEGACCRNEDTENPGKQKLLALKTEKGKPDRKAGAQSFRPNGRKLHGSGITSPRLIVRHAQSR
jgi:hypothetical protein